MKVEIRIPSKLSDITLEQYQKFAKINTEENQDTGFMMHKTVEIFCNLELKDIARIKYNYVKEILEDINLLFENKQELIPTFTMEGVEYGFIPNLDEMTLGEYIDLDENLKDWETMHKAMGILYRPVTIKKDHRYQIEEYSGINKDMSKMPLDVVMGAMVFFYNLNSELLTITLNCLEQELTKEGNIQQLQLLEKSGDGIRASMDLAREMLPNLRLYLN